MVGFHLVVSVDCPEWRLPEQMEVLVTEVCLRSVAVQRLTSKMKDDLLEVAGTLAVPVVAES